MTGLVQTSTQLRAQRRVAGQLTAVLAFAVAILCLASSGCGGGSGASTQVLGGTTTTHAVLTALEGIGYHLRFRKVPHVAEYEVLAGEARHRGSRVQFSVEIRRAGPFEDIEHRREENPQPAIVRYGVEQTGEIVGDVRYSTESQAPMFLNRESELESSKAEQRMCIRIDLALKYLFAPKYRPGV